MVKLSASRIKTYSSCSWLGYCKYNLKLPSKSNDGAKLGGCTHVILECLAEKKRFDLVNQALQLQCPLAVPSIDRLAKKLLKKESLYNDESIAKIDGFLLVALENDFFGKGCKQYMTEYEFDLKTDNYWVGGFIDRLFEYEDHVRILDFKTSKKKFAKGTEELEFNVQALIYALVASKMFPNKKIIVEFLFVKFRKDPKIVMKFSQKQLDGFEQYLGYISSHISNFSTEDALGDLASEDVKRKWLCGYASDPFALKKDGTPHWHCEYRYPSIYFEATKEGQKTISASSKKELEKYQRQGYEIVQKRYAGCPKWN